MIILAAPLEAVIHAEGERAYPNECCGVLLGVQDAAGVRRVEALIPIVNARESEEQYHRFRIEADDFMRAETEARAQGKDVLGFYHSHPDHPALPSEYDREYALPFYSYIIVSVAKGKAGLLTSWELTLDRSRF
ncbi:MAG: M67 family metallopeptidase, partial [Zoogloeaceae bacterium]|nr:M67 family metallopeptidase [Zoogloeaceae bacterium]